MTTPFKMNNPYLMNITHSTSLVDSINKNTFTNTISSFNPSSPQQQQQTKFTKLQLIPPVKQKVTFLDLKKPHSLTSKSQQKKEIPKSKGRKYSELMKKDELQTLEDQIEMDAYQVSPYSERAGDVYKQIFKKIDTIVQKKQMYNTKKYTVFAALANSSVKEKLMPRTLGMVSVSPTKQERTLDASNFHMGDRYAKILCQGVKQAPEFYDQVNLKYNNLTQKSADALKHLIPAKVKGLNLEGNQLGVKSDELMNMLVNNRYGQLQILNLEHNRFNDASARQLFKYLYDNTKIVKLNLSRNYITDLSMFELKELLQKTVTLQEVYLHWNRIHSQGGSYIIQGLYGNSSVKVLDLSFNSLGIQSKDDTQNKNRIQQLMPQSWGDYLKKSGLVHLDLSNNQFSQSHAEYISQCLESNHTLYGFHFSGNAQSNIDYLEFLNCLSKIQTQPSEMNKDVILRKSEDYETSMVGALQCRRINGISALSRLHSNSNEICWICDGWVEYTFYWKPNHLDIKKEPIFIHFSHERYAPVKLELLDDIYQERSPMSQKHHNGLKVWYIKRMVPSKKTISFFFSSPFLKKSQTSHQYDVKNWNRDEINKKVVFYTVDNKQITFRRPPQCNIIKIDQQQIIDHSTYEPVVSCKPRIKDYSGIFDLIVEEQEPEAQGEDFFKDCHRDNDNDFKLCFEYDWNRSQIPKFIKEEEIDVIKNYLKGIYRDLVAAYRNYSAYSPCGDIWCIPLNVYTDIFSNCLVDKAYQLKDLDITYKQTTSKYINETRGTTANALLRFQFMEIIVRLAIDKYCKGFQQISTIDAIRKVYEQDGLQKKVEQIVESQEWRDQSYWSPECNSIIGKYMPQLQQLYQLGVSFRQLNYFTSKQFINPQGFRDIFAKVGLISDANAERNVNLAYCLSVQLVIDEVNTDNHLQMEFNEFVEALARIADKYGQKGQSQTSNSEQLSKRLESLIKLLINGYNIQDEQASTKSLQKRIPKINKKTSFVQENVNHLVYEIEGSPLIQQPNIDQFDSI